MFSIKNSKQISSERIKKYPAKNLRMKKNIEQTQSPLPPTQLNIIHINIHGPSLTTIMAKITIIILVY